MGKKQQNPFLNLKCEEKQLHVGEGATPFPGLLHFTLEPYLIMLNVKQGGIKYHF